MNESFANYSMFLVQEAFVPEQYSKLFNRYTEIAKDAPPVSTATLFSENSYNSYYTKGAILLKELEQKIGKDKMLTWLELMIKKDVKTTKEALDLLEATTDNSTRLFMEELMRS